MKLLVIAGLLLWPLGLAAQHNRLTPKEVADGWHLLFDGKTLDGWKFSDDSGTFSVRDGKIVVHGPTSHLFYLGPINDHRWTDFELKLDIMTFAGANSGVYFHTAWQPSGWPEVGYEAQVNNTHGDPSKTAGLCNIRDNPKSPVRDSVWFTMTVRVEGKKITVEVNDNVITEYLEEPTPKRPPALKKRVLGSGTFSLQGHDQGSEVHYRNVKVRALTRRE